MQIQTNTSSLFTQRALGRSQQDLGTSLRRLSSGLRVNSAADDAAGLAIADRLRAQIRGDSQAARNANDAVSMLQTAEGALATTADMLQRMRELAVQAANSTNSAGDRKSLQSEINQLLNEVSRVGSDTNFNGEKLFAQATSGFSGDKNQRAVVYGLKLGWLESSESMIRQYYGLEADGQQLTIDLTFTDGAGNVAASVSGTVGAGGKTDNMKLNIDMADFTPPNLPNGGNKPFYNDRIIAHEMVHAVMGRSMNFAAVPTWFKEGAAEFIHGADERLASDIAGSSVAAVVGTLNDGGFGGNSIDYSAAYAAVRYMHARLKAMGTDGVKAVMSYLTENQSASLNDALNSVTSGTWATSAAFVADFKTAGNGDTFVSAMNLANADTGAIGGLDADGGSERNAEMVVASFGSRYGTDVLSGFAEVFPTLPTGGALNQFTFQVGANEGQTINVFTPSISSIGLGIEDIDLVANPTLALVQIDDAIDYLNGKRSELGAAQSRMETTIAYLDVSHEMGSASLSRVVDADYAAETASLIRSRIIQNASMAMVAQANSTPRLALALLRA